MEILIANADVGEEIEGTTMVTAVGVEIELAEITKSHLTSYALCTLAAFHMTGILFMMIIFKISYCDD